MIGVSERSVGTYGYISFEIICPGSCYKDQERSIS